MCFRLILSLKRFAASLLDSRKGHRDPVSIESSHATPSFWPGLVPARQCIEDLRLGRPDLNQWQCRISVLEISRCVFHQCSATAARLTHRWHRSFPFSGARHIVALAHVAIACVTIPRDMRRNSRISPAHSRTFDGADCGLDYNPGVRAVLRRLRAVGPGPDLGLEPAIGVSG